MIDTRRSLLVVAAWASVVYVVCFVGVAIVPGLREWFFLYALHMSGIVWGENVLSITTFISGLAIWNVVASLGTWLFATLWNNIK